MLASCLFLRDETTSFIILKIIFVFSNSEEPNSGISSGSAPFTKAPVHILVSLAYKEFFFNLAF